jgi:3-isopropylmalate/(R)-2-methylmalate dehydratase small subunit
VTEASVIKKVSGRALPLRGDEIDTDRIIPARYMTSITFDGLGEFAFRDARFDQAGKPKDHPMNDARFKGSSVLLVGRNFGCGSSREHAPQALLRAGFRALLGVSFADIFAGNCAAIGVPAVVADAADVESLMAAVEAEPSLEIVVDLEAMKAGAGKLVFPVRIAEARRRNFLAGEWDTTATLLSNRERTSEIASRLPYLSGFAVSGGGS